MMPEGHARNGGGDPGTPPAGDRTDDPLDALARELRRPVDAPGLWERIEEELSRRAAGLPPHRPGDVPRWRRWLVAAAAAAVLSAGLLLFSRRPPREAPVLLVDRAQADRMEREQRRLEAALFRLLPAFEVRARSGGEEALFAADQLAYLDAGLEDCRRARTSNPFNEGVQQAILACTRKKVEIIRAFLSK